MSISGLILTVNKESKNLRDSLEVMRSDKRLTIDEQFESMLAVVLDTESVEEDMECFRMLEELPGVEGIEIVCVHYEP